MKQKITIKNELLLIRGYVKCFMVNVNVNIASTKMRHDERSKKLMPDVSNLFYFYDFGS